jgi:ATP-binding cassette subfamily F protein 3
MISLNKVLVRFGADVLFKDVSLRISGKDRVSFIGSNGTGKTTMLRLITGEMHPDEGEISISKHTTVGYLPQEGIRLSGNTLYEEVYNSAGDINEIQKELREIEIEMGESKDTASEEFLDLLEEYGELQEKFQLLDGFKIKSKIEKILIGLGFKESDFDRLTEEFSGGWQMRIALAKLLLKNPSILLLDEPTNHLDIESLIWVENYLKNYHGAIVLVSHDRNFLDNITRRTVELSLGKVTEYSGNYSFYRMERKQRKELLENIYKNQQKYIKEQEKFIERFRYKATKAKAVQSRIKRLDKMDVVELEEEESSVRFNFPPATHSGKITMELEGVSKSYDGKNYVLDDIDLLIKRGEKLAFLGTNGAGKSTLARIIAGTEKINKGKVKSGHLVDIKLYAQHQAEELDGSKTVLEIMEEASKGEILKTLRTVLGGFLFRGDDVFKKVGVLSGGEKSRLALAKMLIEPSNFLILDEPTNHLDMLSKDVLMNALQKYTGTVLIVSHDRQFLDGIIDKVIEVKDKELKTYVGNCSDYLKAKEAEQEQIDASKEKKETKGNKTSKGREKYISGYEQKQKKKELNQLIMPVKRKIKELEEEVTRFEQRKKELEDEMSKEDFYKDANKVIDVQNEYNNILKILDESNSLWEIETEKLNNLEKQFISN